MPKSLSTGFALCGQRLFLARWLSDWMFGWLEGLHGWRPQHLCAPGGSDELLHCCSLHARTFALALALALALAFATVPIAVAVVTVLTITITILGFFGRRRVIPPLDSQPRPVTSDLLDGVERDARLHREHAQRIPQR